MDRDLGDRTAEPRGRLDVVDTLEELRANIDDLIDRLSKLEAEEPPDSAEPVPTSGPLDFQIDDLGRKVEGASDMLAELADILESQTERIETIEQQLGDPDLRRTAVVSGRASAESADERIEALRTWLGLRFERVENAVAALQSSVAELQVSVSEVREIGVQGDRRVRELEERLLILVDSGLAEAVPRQVPSWPVVPPAEPSYDAAVAAGVQATTPRAPSPSFAGASAEATAAAAGEATTGPRPLNLAHRPAAEAPASAAPEPAPGRVAQAGGSLQAECGDTIDSRVARRLEELVEREVRLQQEFGPGAAVSPRTESASPGAARAVRTGKARPTVMVVDDSPDARTILSIYLSKTGYQVVTAASAEDCLAKLRHHDVDAVVLDASMPGGGGEHVCRILRDDPVYRGQASLPVIVYTAHPDAFPREKATQLGAADYVIKGGDMLPLITALVRHTKSEDR